MELVWFECSSCHDQVEQNSCLHCFSEQYHSHLPISLVCATIEAGDTTSVVQGACLVAVRGIALCV